MNERAVKVENVQLENGYTKIANELLEALSKTALNGTQWRIVLTIIRFTYGFNKKEAEMSLKLISNKTGINIKQVGRELNLLIKYKIVLVTKEANFKKSRVISFNKKYSKWIFPTEQMTVNGLDDSQQIKELTVNGLVDLTVNGLDDPLYIVKETIKETIKEKHFFENAEVNNLFLEFLQLRKKLKAVNTERAINELLKKLNAYEDGIKIEMIKNSIVNSWKSVFPLKQGKNKSDNEPSYNLDEAFKASWDIVHNEENL